MIHRRPEHYAFSSSTTIPIIYYTLSFVIFISKPLMAYNTLQNNIILSYTLRTECSIKTIRLNIFTMNKLDIPRHLLPTWFTVFVVGNNNNNTNNNFIRGGIRNKRLGVSKNIRIYILYNIQHGSTHQTVVIACFDFIVIFFCFYWTI